MAYHSYMKVASSFFLFSCVISLSLAQNDNIKLPLKAVNLGNWLVIEGWMKPSLFDGILNKDLLDGTQVQLMSTKFQKYLAAENGGGTTVVANRDSASGWETFKLWRINETYYNFRVNNKQFFGLENQGQGNGLVAVSNTAGYSETFQIVRKDDDPSRIRIKASNGMYIQAISDASLTATYGDSNWDDNDPSVFKMNIVRTLQGEYQITNGYGPDKAPQVLRDHWNSYVTDDDFRFLSSNVINAVRIPVGWWIAKDPTPSPFVEGSLQVLDNAFTWAEKYGMKVIVDLHAVQGSQNGNEHSGTRDGFQEWGDSYIEDTVAVIDFLAQRYANRIGLAAVELINEPLAPGVSLDSLKTYYQAGYDAVRKYTSSAYVILSNRLAIADPTELLSFASGGHSHVVIEVHYYNLFTATFKNMDAQQNIDYINNQRASDLGTITTSNGPLTFGNGREWNVNGASVEDYQRFGMAQLGVYGRATFGWGYWAYKCAANHWSLKWMIENNYIKLV